MKAGILTQAAAGVLLLAVPPLDAQTTRVQNASMGVLQTSTGNGVGFPGKVLLAWPRSEVHKQYGFPTQFLARSQASGGYAETTEVEWTFKTPLAVADVYDRMPGLSAFRIWLYYHIDTTAGQLGIRQRVEAVKVVPDKPRTLWDFMETSAADLPEAADLCGGSCVLYRIRAGHDDYVLAVPKDPTGDQLEIGRWVGVGYDTRSSDQPWCPAMKLHLKPGSWIVNEIQILAVPLNGETRSDSERQVETIGLWKAGPTG